MWEAVYMAVDNVVSFWRQNTETFPKRCSHYDYTSPTRQIWIRAVEEAQAKIANEKGKPQKTPLKICQDDISEYDDAMKTTIMKQEMTVLHSNYRDEENMAEFVLHHLLLGFDHVLLFDDKSHLDFNPIVELDEAYHRRVTVIRMCEAVNKIHLIDLVLIAATDLNVKWLAMLDADEFIAFPDINETVSSWIDTFPYETKRININWLTYGSSFLETHPQDQLLMESFIYRARSASPIVKTIVKLNKTQYWRLPHHPHNLIYDGLEQNDPGLRNSLYGVITEPYWSAKNEQYPFMVKNGSITSAVIVHFMFQARNTCIERKILRKADDGTGLRVNLMRNESIVKWENWCSHSHCNAVLDNLTLAKYGPRVRED